MKNLILLFLISVLGLSACSSSAPVAPAVTPNAGIDPEVVVQEFLTDYQEAPMQLGGYLSQRLQEKTPVDAYQKLLPLDGMIEGFAVQSASRMGDEAAITVAVRAGGFEAQILFNLVRQNQNWFIDSISKAP